MRAAALLCALGVGLLAVPSSPSPAHEGATGIVKQRMDDMDTIGRALKRISERVKARRDLGKIEPDAEAIRAAAVRMPSLFPPGSQDGHSDAKPAIWDRWQDFLAAARALEEEAGKLGTAARAGNDAEVAAQVRAVTRACSGCHTPFKAKG